MDHVEVVIVGAGVIGLAIARHLARRGHEVLLLEAENAIGQHTSSRNSQVIHAGIYYGRGSLQQRLCQCGKAMLYDYCETRHVGHQRCGKLTVAADAGQLDKLHALCAHGAENGVDDLYVIPKAEVKEREPAVTCVGAMVSPSSGIVDAPGLMLSLLGEAEAAGAMLALNAPLYHVQKGPRGLEIKVGDTAGTTLSTTTLINAAALGAWDVARAVKGIDRASIPPRFMAKGSYFSITGKSPFHSLIYPMPQAHSLGIHSVQDLAGGVRFGPNMEWVDRVDYTVEPTLKTQFETAVRTYWPDLPKGALQPDMSGIRPRIWGPGQAKRSFLVQGAKDHGIPGLIQLFGFESPGLTSCLAIGEYIASLMDAAD